LIHSWHTSKLHDSDHHHHSTPNRRCEQLLTGWKQGATKMDFDIMEQAQQQKWQWQSPPPPHHTDHHMREQLHGVDKMGWDNEMMGRQDKAQEMLMTSLAPQVHSFFFSHCFLFY
jgi:hypothetical protein